MKTFAALPRPLIGPLLAALAVALAAPVIAQSNQADAGAETRIRKLEAEVRALQRQVFPGGDGKFFPPLTQPGQPTTATTGTPASTPVADLLVRVDAIEAQLARLTAQQEESGNKLAQLEAKVAALTPAAPASVAAVPAETPAATTAVTGTNGATTSGNLAAMTGGASTAKPAVTVPTAAATPASKPAATKPAATAKPAVPSAARLAAVKAIEKPKTADAGDDEYSYGFRLWEAKFYPEAQQQLKLFLEKYPRHERRSFARNLLGRALLDEGKPEEAQKWFLENYKDKQFRDRAADSVLFLAEATKRQKDTGRACIALAQFVDEFPGEAAGRLKYQYDATRTGLKCD